MGIDVSRYAEYDRLEKEIKRLRAALDLSEEYNQQKDEQIERLRAERDEFRQRCRQWRDELLALCCVGNSQQVHLALTRIQFDMLDWVAEKQAD